MYRMPNTLVNVSFSLINPNEPLNTIIHIISPISNPIPFINVFNFMKIIIHAQ